MNHFLYLQHYRSWWLPIFRIGTAVILMASFISLWFDYHSLYGPKGLVDPALLRLQLDSSTPTFPLASEAFTKAAYCALCLFLASGLFTRIVALLLLLLHSSIFIGNPGYSYGFDYIAASTLFYCFLFPAGSLCSLDRSLFGAAHTVALTPWLRLLQLHLCLIYFFAGLEKIMGPTWRNGEALYKAVNQPGFDGPLGLDLSPLAAFPVLWVIGGWLVIILELAYAAMVWVTPVRPYWIWAIIGLHLGILLLMGLYFFAALMILLNLVAFYYPYVSIDHTPKTQNKPSYTAI